VLEALAEHGIGLVLVDAGGVELGQFLPPNAAEDPVRVIESSLEERPKTVAGRRFRRQDLPICLNLERRIRYMKRTETGLLIVAGEGEAPSAEKQQECSVDFSPHVNAEEDKAALIELPIPPLSEGEAEKVAVLPQLGGPAAAVEERGPEEGPASTNTEPARKQDSESCLEGQAEGGVAP